MKPKLCYCNLIGRPHLASRWLSYPNLCACLYKDKSYYFVCAQCYIIWGYSVLFETKEPNWCRTALSQSCNCHFWLMYLCIHWRLTKMKYSRILTHVYSNTYWVLTVGLTPPEAQEDSSENQALAFLELALWWDSESNCSLNVEVMGDFLVLYFYIFLSFLQPHF